MLSEKYQEALLADAGCHSSEEVPTDEAERLQFAILEAIDFGCPTFDWKCPGRGAGYDGLTMGMLKAAAKEAATNGIDVPPPSYLGLLTGAFAFLTKERE